MTPSNSIDSYLSLQNDDNRQSIVVLGEVLWDIFEQSRRLGGAALNFAAHAKRLGHAPSLISAVGTDSLGEEAASAITDLGLDTTFLQKTNRFPTGTARVKLGPGDRTAFVIERPAAYDAIQLSDQDLKQLAGIAPTWFYYGTLFASTTEGEAVLGRVLHALPDAIRFYDLNLRPGCDSPDIVSRLLTQADVVKLNEDELHAVHEITGLPREYEAFCREGSRQYGWRAICVTLGARGCALLAFGQYAHAGGHVVDVVDSVGAGDAFCAAFVHGLISRWPAAVIAKFANRVGALVASRRGAIPDWSIEEAVGP